MSKQIGYARVSTTTHQATDRQVEALKDAGCNDVYNVTRTCEGDRPQLQACLASVN